MFHPTLGSVAHSLSTTGHPRAEAMNPQGWVPRMTLKHTPVNYQDLIDFSTTQQILVYQLSFPLSSHNPKK
jgi:hypothetical protein